jgi:Cu/Ag efflux protein CusF
MLPHSRASHRTTIPRLFVALSLAGSALFLLALRAEHVAAADERYASHGTVKSFGPKRAFVNIAHEKIPGYMEAMTMSFEPRSEAQLSAIDVGARVAFSFVATSDGRRVLDQITKE